jgi:DHA3 family macrolide efflux protein-like MFS transporter
MPSLKRLKLYQTLSHRPIFVLWLGQALSAVGDEIYRVALTWIAVGMVGASAGFLGAAQASAVIVFGLIGGYWADRWDPRRTMLFADYARGLAVLVPVLWSIFFPLNIWLLALVAILVAALSTFFEPALQAVVPRLAPNRVLLQATNGLMGTTMRLARAVGPSLVGALTGMIPIIHFFTLDALSFGCSAWAISRLRSALPVSPIPAPPRSGMRQVVFSGYQLVRHDRIIKYVILAKTLTTGAWHLVLPLGIALIVRDQLPGDVRAYGLLLGAYGIGNVSSALVLTNISMRRPLAVMGWGYVVLGLGFAGLALLPTLWGMALSLAFAAVGGPMNDLAHIDVIQGRVSPDKLAGIVRFRMSMESGGTLIFLLLSPALFSWCGPRFTIGLAGFVTLLVGALGILRFGEKHEDKAL